MRGAMDTGQLVRIVEDAVFPYLGGVRLLRHANRISNAPSETFTLVFGDWDEGHWYNVSVPTIPERTIKNPDGTINRYGWRELLRDFVRDRVCSLTPAIEKALEDEAPKFRRELQSRRIPV